MNIRAALTHPPEWHAERRKGIGGSDASKIMSGDWHALWLDKTGRAEPEDLSKVLPVAMGSFTEALNLYWFELITDVKVTTENCEGLVSTDHPHMRANLDGRAEPNIFEAKHINAFAKAEEARERYYPQVQHSLVVTGAPACYLSIFVGTLNYEYFLVEADEKYQAELIERERAFWQHVIDDKAPEQREAAVAKPIPLDDMREVDMSASNAWANFATVYCENMAGAALFKSAGSELKALVEEDVKRASGHSVEINRAKNGSLRIKKMKDVDNGLTIGRK